MVGWPEGISLVQKMCTPHNTNAFAMKIADTINCYYDYNTKFKKSEIHLTNCLR